MLARPGLLRQNPAQGLRIAFFSADTIAMSLIGCRLAARRCTWAGAAHPRRDRRFLRDVLGSEVGVCRCAGGVVAVDGDERAASAVAPPA